MKGSDLILVHTLFCVATYGIGLVICNDLCETNWRGFMYQNQSLVYVLNHGYCVS